MGRGGSRTRSTGEAGAPVFGERLRRLREAAGLTQEELAGRASLTAKAISMLERGRRKRPYPHTVRALADALGLPEAERAALLSAVPKRGGAVLAAVVPLRGDITGVAGLPTPTTRLVGRERELREISELLGGGGTRLLTLTGPGGVGKTRLAIEAARETTGPFPHGKSFVALAPLGDASLVIPTVVRSLGLRESGDRTPIEVASAHLADKGFLLVIDNFEHLLDAAPEIATLIEACPDLVVLATSRAPLRIRAEQGYLVQPLALPARSPSFEVVGNSPSVRLFLERARAASPAFVLDGTNASSVAEICRRLDGLPLALELASTKIRYLDPQTLLSRLDQALSAAGARDLPERQKTMRATLDWSYGLLHEPERGLFRRLSVFAGGFALEAAEEVGATPSGTPDDVLDRLGRLSEQSLVRVGVGDDKPRYGMLEPVRQYALEKLEESGDAEEAGRRHALYYLALGERTGLQLKGPDQPTLLGQLETELGNLRAAVRWSIDHGELEALARTAWSMWKFWWLRGHRVEVCRWIEEALRSAPGSLADSVRAKLLYVAATLGHASGDPDSARPLIEESLGLFRRLEDGHGVAEASSTMGLVALGQERYEEGLACLEESADLFLELGRKRAAGSVLGFAATAPLMQGDTALARRLAERALSLAREPGGAKDVVCSALHPLAAVARAEGDDERAERLLGESLTISVEIGDEGNVAYCLEGLAAIAADEDELERAARLWGAAEAILETVDAPTHPHALYRPLHHRSLSDVRARLGDEAWEGAWAEGRAMPPDRAVGYALEGAAAQGPRRPGTFDPRRP